ncbi:MAG: hypothetical protein PHU23_00160 [Dehalococcoidales bacterium]|nr:hypothetical protein [Dehalococcoidales bacterium]
MGVGSVTPIRYDLAQMAIVDQVLSATQFVSNSLKGFDSGTFAGYSVWVLSKANGSATGPKGESPKLISAFDGFRAVFPTLSGTVTHATFTASLTVGDTVLLLNPAVAAGFRPPSSTVPPTTPSSSTMYGSVTANWQAAEQDLLTIGTAVLGTSTLINFLGVGIQNLVGNITIRMYATINGTERRFYPIPSGTTFSVAGDAPCIPVINGSMTVPGRLRVTIQSDNVADNGQTVDYEAN